MVFLSGYYVAYANHVKIPEEHLQSLLELFSMFKISIWYDETIVTIFFPYSVRIMCINSGKTIGCLLENQTIENFINIFVTNMVFRHVGLS